MLMLTVLALCTSRLSGSVPDGGSLEPNYRGNRGGRQVTDISIILFAYADRKQCLETFCFRTALALRRFSARTRVCFGSLCIFLTLTSSSRGPENGDINKFATAMEQIAYVSRIC